MQRRNNRIYIILGIIFVIIGVVIGIIPFIISYNNLKVENKKIEEFFQKPYVQNNDLIYEEKSISESSNKHLEESYLMILEIPKINLKKGLYNIDSKYNSVNYNIEILKESDMPNIENGHLILAGHNGNSSVSYFDKLNKLEKNDVVNVFYNNIKYTYKIDNIYEIDKNGTANIKQNKKTTIIALITCKKYSDDKQIVFIGNLVDKENY